MLPYDSVAAKNILLVLGRFEALEESKTKIKVVMWQLVKESTVHHRLS